MAYIWATMVALSRVVLGVHFPLDTVAGAILGSTVSLITCALLI
ncbi:MAG: phosphatase PAP2 family protein [bacterium]